MPLITTIEEVRANGVQVNFINNDSSIADMTAAEQMFIEPVLGNELYEELVNDPGGNKDLLVYVKRALAPLAYWLDLPNIQTQITDKGVSTAESNNGTAAHRWEFETLRDSLETKGCFALEKLLQYLTQQQELSGEQLLPEDYNLIFKTGIDFCKYFPIYQPYRTFFNLRPIVKLVEDQYIRSTIGNDFYEEMRDIDLPPVNQRNNDQRKQSQVLEFIKKVAAYFTISESVNMLPVKISNHGFTVSLSNAVDSQNPNDQQAPNAQLYNLRDSAAKKGDINVQELYDFLNANATDALFATYKNSKFYVAPSTEEQIDINSTSNIFTL